MRRISILTTLLAIVVCHAMAKNDTLSVHNALQHLQSKVVFNKSNNETPYYKLQDVRVPVVDDIYSVFTDESCENIGFLCTDPATRSEKKPKVMLSVYRVSDGKQLYSKVFKWRGEDFVLSKTTIAELSMMNTSIVDLATGEVLQQKKEGYLGLIGDNIILGTTVGLSETKKVAAYSITTGESIWKKALISSDGLTYNQPIDSVSDYIVTGKLIRVNWLTGEMKALDAKTSITNKKVLWGQIIAGVAMGVAGGIIGGGTGYHPIFIPTGSYKTISHNRSFFIFPGSDKIAGLTSGVLQKDGRNFFADRKTIRCFDDNMTEIWNTELPEKGTRSDLVLKGDTVFMLNLALGVYGNGNIQHREKPYIAAFNANDGKQLFYQPVDINESVKSSTLTNNTLRLLFNDREAIYNFSTSKLNIAPHDTTIVGAYSRYVFEGQYLKKNSDDTFTPITPADDMVLAMTNKGNIMNLANSSAAKEYTPDNIYMVTYRSGETCFVEPLVDNDQAHDLWCINNGKPILVSKDVIFTKKKPNNLILYLTNQRIQILSIK